MTLDVFEELAIKLNLSQPFEIPFWQGKAFQLCAVHKIHQAKRCILSMDKGMGKTSTVFAAFEPIADEWDYEHPGEGKWTCVILTTKRGMMSYVRDINLFPDPEGKVQLVYTPEGVGNKGRAIRHAQWRNPRARYFVTTYASLLSDMGHRAKTLKANREIVAPKWVMNAQMDALVMDEFHRFFRNRGSATFELLHDYFRKIKYFVPLSGSAVSKGPEDLWAALHLCDPKFWSSYWNYVATWSEIRTTGFGKQVSGPKLDPKKMGGIDMERVAKWRNAVRPYVFHATAEMVPNQMPPIMNYPLDVMMTKEQADIHEQLKTKLFLEMPDSEYLFNENTLSNLHVIRTSLICPKTIHPDYGYGAGIEAIADDVEEGETFPYAIFTPFRDPIPHLKEYLELRGHKVTVLWGGISVEEQEKRLQEWRDSITYRDSKYKASCVLTTIKYAESWEIPQAKDGYFLGYEYDPEDNDQARKRLRRLISKDPVRIQWVRLLGSYDEEHLTRLMEKTDGKRAMMNDWAAYIKQMRSQHTNTNTNN